MQPKYTSPISQRISQAGPAPPRLQIPGVQPDQLDVVYSQKPRPARIESEYEDFGPQRFPQSAPQPINPSFPTQLFGAAEAAPRPKVKTTILLRKKPMKLFIFKLIASCLCCTKICTSTSTTGHLFSTTTR